MSIPMPRELVEQRLAAVQEHQGNVSAAAITLGIGRATLQNTVATAKRYGIEIPKLQERGSNGRPAFVPVDMPGRLNFNLADGIILVGSDCHYHPGIASTAHRAFVKFCRDLRPNAVVLNGDILDGATISRHPPLEWHQPPSLIQELETCKERLDEIVVAADKCQRFWPRGNHCQRFNTRLATVAPEYARVNGTDLADHFPDWQQCWSVWVNDNLVITHRAKGGIHATHNNVLNSGVSMVTGHLHSLKVTPFTDYRDCCRYGVDCGTMAPVWGAQFEYLETNFRNWRSGFVILTFKNKELLWPEVVLVRDEASGEVEFRGQVISV